MLERYLHHPALRIVVPATIAMAILYAGEVISEKVSATPVRNVPPAQKSIALPDITLPPVFIRGSKSTAGVDDSDIARAFGAPEPEKEEVVQAPTPAPVPVPIVQTEPPLMSYLSSLNIDAVGSEGIFINGIFKKFGEKLDVAIPPKKGGEVRIAILEGLGPEGISVRVGDETVNLRPNF